MRVASSQELPRRKETDYRCNDAQFKVAVSRPRDCLRQISRFLAARECLHETVRGTQREGARIPSCHAAWFSPRLPPLATPLRQAPELRRKVLFALKYVSMTAPARHPSRYCCMHDDEGLEGGEVGGQARMLWKSSFLLPFSSPPQGYPRISETWKRLL